MRSNSWNLYLKLEQLRYPLLLLPDSRRKHPAGHDRDTGNADTTFRRKCRQTRNRPRGTGEIIIRLSLQDQLLIIDITDDGPGLDTEANGGFGIRAVTNEFEILKTLYNTEIGITIENRQEKEAVSGCHVRLSIPL